MTRNVTIFAVVAVVLVTATGVAVASTGSVDRNAMPSDDRNATSSADRNATATDLVATERWNRTYERPGTQTGWAIVRTDDGGYAMTGLTDPEPEQTSETNVTVVKLRPDRSVEWVREVDTGYVDSGNDIIQTADGGFAVTGIDAVAKLGPDGSVEWSQQLGGDGHSIIQLDDGDLLVAGKQWAGASDAMLRRLSPDGETRWSRHYDMNPATNESLPDTDVAYDVDQTDSGFVAVGTTNSSEETGNPFLLWTDESGVVQHEDVGEAPVPNGGSHVIWLPDGDVLVAGWMTAEDTGKNVVVSRVGPDGSVRWSRGFMDEGLEDAEDFYPVNDAVVTMVNQRGENAASLHVLLPDGTVVDSVDVTGPPGAAYESMTRPSVEADSVDYALVGQRPVDDGPEDLWVSGISVSQGDSPSVGSNPARDLDGDGLYEDVTGDGAFNIIDVGLFLQERNGDAVQSNADAFDFTGDGSVNIIDVGKLLAMSQS